VNWGYWLLIVLGGTPGPMNLLWGGFLSCISEFTIFGAVYQPFACHEPRCWRPGHLMADEHTRSCWSHHPDGKPKPGHVLRAHERHQAASQITAEGD
jgi:hypothetical protein